MEQLLRMHQNSHEDIVNYPRKALTGVCFLFPDPADRLGKFIIAGGAAVGLGALCYYGMGMSSEIGAIERAA